MAANPKNIMAGKECDATNKFLQQLAKAASSDQDSKPVVEKILKMLEAKRQREGQAPKGGQEEPAGGQQSNFEAKVNKQLEQENLKRGRDQKEQEEEENEGNIRFGKLRRKTKKGTIAARAGPSTGNDDGAAQPDERGKTSIEGMKKMIQKVTQSTTRLGKFADFVEDDLESMSREYDSWSKVYEGSRQQFEKEEGEIEKRLQTYKDKITNKEEQIRERKSQIQSLKTQILRNDAQIKKLLSSIVGGSKK